MLPDGSEHPCDTIDVSPGGLRLKALFVPYRGQRIVAYLSELGRIEGTATRILKDGFALSIDATGRKREKLLTALTWACNRDDGEVADTRGASRIVPRRATGVLTLADGRRIRVGVANVSSTGAAITSPDHLPLDSSVLLGHRAAIVLRVEDGSYALAFTTPISDQELNPGIAFE